LASSVEFSHSISHFFYVVPARLEGMPGSSYLALLNWRHYSLDRNTGLVRIIERPLSWRLLGVYSERRNPSDGFEAQIGIIWREHLIYEIIATKKIGSATLHSSHK
jgi:hypothetical protein